LSQPLLQSETHSESRHRMHCIQMVLMYWCVSTLIYTTIRYQNVTYWGRSGRWRLGNKRESVRRCLSAQWYGRECWNIGYLASHNTRRSNIPFKWCVDLSIVVVLWFNVLDRHAPSSRRWLWGPSRPAPWYQPGGNLRKEKMTWSNSLMLSCALQALAISHPVAHEQLIDGIHQFLPED